ncbi:calcium-activated chloride channel regulator 1-like [Spea bombifrons]|uniref:calcium-activated chloride channel regulator 1-like n=1 Tax=Spea bombifrons TaxID=233779 RepID=UPI00234B3B18|nr:calcium-activated chloride channel regulator 1-like [Spea bombifrons]
MELLNILTVVSLFHTVHCARESLVQLKDNGYEDIVIAISPNQPENPQLIEKIKNMLTDASTYMLQATKKRVFIRSAKILIPNTWSSKSDYGRPKMESYDKADLIVADPFIYGDDPYTLQYGRCGERGKYIHLTPNFLLNDEVLRIYGPRGRVFVHEWAHLRWGVFDEYNPNQPYYLSGQGQVEATRCPSSLKGLNKIDVCVGTSCTKEDCEYDKNNLFEEGCEFYPNIDGSIKESIMYGQGLEPVHEFCDKNSHNSEAPNQQNRLCNHQSTWEVIMKSSDMSNTSPLADTNVPPPVISLLQYKDRVVTLVLDVSGSMSGANRIIRLYQASEVYVMQIIETGSHLGIVIFSTDATVKSELVKITDTFQREKLKSLLPTIANGGTNICAGVRAGLEVNKKLDGNTYGTEIVLLTDGEDSGIRSCFPEVTNSGAIIHTIALGNSADKALEELAEITGGLKLYASDNVDANGLIDAFSGIVTSSGDLTQQSIQIESTALRMGPSQCLDGTVIIDNTVGNDTFFLVTWVSGIPSITLKDPKGKVYGNNEFASDQVSKSARLMIPGITEKGRWEYSLCNTLTVDQVIGITVNSRAADENMPPIVAEAYMNADASSYPNPMIVYAIVTQGLSPVLGATVTAIIEPQTGAIQDLQLLDNGAGADILKNDGIYSKYFTSFSGNGRYNLKVRVESTTQDSKLASPKSRALYLPGIVVNGTIQSNPPKPKPTFQNVTLGDFSRTTSGGAFIVTNVPAGPLPDIYKPDRITDLDALIQGNRVTLSWTATGDDLDHGNASRYDLRMSLTAQELLNNFANATFVNISSITPQPAGSRETFTFEPENITLKNGTIIYFALIAFDDSNQNSDVSNIARAVLYIPPPPKPTSDNNSAMDISGKMSTILMVLTSGLALMAALFV